MSFLRALCVSVLLSFVSGFSPKPDIEYSIFDILFSTHSRFDYDIGIMDDVFAQIQSEVEQTLGCSAHAMDHIQRVVTLCERLAQGQDVDHEVLRASALLHDIARVREDDDPSGQTDHALIGADMAADVLARLGFPSDKIEHVRQCILTHRYRTQRTPESLEAKILFDADKLDTLGAIGIARSFVWVGRNNARLTSEVDIHEYIQDNLGGRINGRIRDKTKHTARVEFETKLKFIGEQLHTEAARDMARERTAFYRDFLERMEREVEGQL